MASTLRVSLANNCLTQRLFLVGLVIVLLSPTLATAAVIFEDDFDGLLGSHWVSDWGQWASQGYDGTNNPPTLVPSQMPIPRPVDTPGKISTGVVGWTTLRADPVNPMDPPGCDPAFDECGPCDPATQECYERADGTLTMDNIDLSNITLNNPAAFSGIHMGLAARMEGVIQRAISGNYNLDNHGTVPQIFFDEFAFGTFGNRFGTMVLPNGALESPIHMELTIVGDDVTFKIGDANNEYEISMVQGTHVHYTTQVPVDHMRPNPNPGRWGFFSHATDNQATDWTLWDNFCFTDPGEICGGHLPGDHDGDGDVDGNDFLWHQISDPGAINTDWGPNYGVVPLSGVAVVPEPSALSFCALGLTALGLLGRRLDRRMCR